MTDIFIFNNTPPFRKSRPVRAPALRAQQIEDALGHSDHDIWHVYSGSIKQDEVFLASGGNIIVLPENIDCCKKFLSTIKSSIIIISQDVYNKYFDSFGDTNTVVFDLLAEKWREINQRGKTYEAKLCKKRIDTLIKKSDVVFSNAPFYERQMQIQNNKLCLIRFPFLVKPPASTQVIANTSKKNNLTINLGRHPWNQTKNLRLLLELAVTDRYKKVFIIDPRQMLKTVDNKTRMVIASAPCITVISNAPFMFIDSMLASSGAYVCFDEMNVEREIATPAHILHALSHGCTVFSGELPGLMWLNSPGLKSFDSLQRLQSSFKKYDSSDGIASVIKNHYRTEYDKIKNRILEEFCRVS